MPWLPPGPSASLIRFGSAFRPPGPRSSARALLQALERLALRLQLLAVPIEIVRAVDPWRCLFAAPTASDIPDARPGRIEPLEVALEGDRGAVRRVRVDHPALRVRVHVGLDLLVRVGVEEEPLLGPVRKVGGPFLARPLVRAGRQAREVGRDAPDGRRVLRAAREMARLPSVPAP